MKAKRKFTGNCENCKKSLCEEHAYFFVDGNNKAITNNSPYLCKECYEKKYNVKIKNDIEVFKDTLVNSLIKIKEMYKVKNIEIDKFIKFIETM